ncbi:hypothetical protein K6L09_37840 [Burkholderia cepacia]
MHDLIDERAPELAELLRNDDAVEVHYSDRYLKSPWAVMALGGFLSLFCNDNPRRLDVVTLAPQEDASGNQIGHDCLARALVTWSG